VLTSRTEEGLGLTQPTVIARRNAKIFDPKTNDWRNNSSVNRTEDLVELTEAEQEQ